MSKGPRNSKQTYTLARQIENNMQNGYAVRDIDDWMFHFERQATPRLKELLPVNRDELPKDLALRLEKLRNVDRACPLTKGPPESQPEIKRRE